MNRRQAKRLHSYFYCSITESHPDTYIFHNDTFRCLFKSMSEDETLCWKTITQEVNSIQDLQRLEGELLRSTMFGSPWSDQLVPELSITELFKL